MTIKQFFGFIGAASAWFFLSVAAIKFFGINGSPERICISIVAGAVLFFCYMAVIQDD